MGPRDEQTDNKATTESPADIEQQDAQTESILPPRVVVELPDGGVQIGEDPQRLQHEQEAQANTANSRPAATSQGHRAGAQPGTEQWLELRRLLYATALEAISLKRKRISSLLVGAAPPLDHHVQTTIEYTTIIGLNSLTVSAAIDLLYMLMSIAAVIFKPRSKESYGQWLPPITENIRLILAILGAFLDCITMVLVLRERRKAIRVIAILHTGLLFPATIHSDVPLVIIRMLVASCLARLIACMVELDWVVSGQPLSRKPKPAWVQGGLLGVQLCGLRHDYLTAMDRIERDHATHGESAPSSEDEFTGWVVWTRSAPVHPDNDTGHALAEMTVAEAETGDTEQSSQYRAVGESNSAGGEEDVPMHHSTVNAGDSGLRPRYSDSQQGVASVMESPEDPAVPEAGTSGTSGGVPEVARAPASITVHPPLEAFHSASSTALDTT